MFYSVQGRTYAMSVIITGKSFDIVAKVCGPSFRRCTYFRDTWASFQRTHSCGRRFLRLVVRASTREREREEEGVAGRKRKPLFPSFRIAATKTSHTREGQDRVTRAMHSLRVFIQSAPEMGVDPLLPSGLVMSYYIWFVKCFPRYVFCLRISSFDAISFGSTCHQFRRV